MVSPLIVVSINLPKPTRGLDALSKRKSQTFTQRRWPDDHTPRPVLALLKYPFYYMIRSRFGKFFGMIHVLTRHLAPELDRFRFCPGFWSMLHFDRKLDIFGDVLTHGYNWAKMRNKRKRPHAKDGTERGQKGPRPAGLEPLGRPA